MTVPLDLNLREDYVDPNLEFIVNYNKTLEKDAKLSRLNEKFFEDKMAELDAFCPIREEAYFFTRLRLHELLLLCAANYANNFEFSAVGDLMFNPRLILIHIKGCHDPVIKERHTPLTAQFIDKAGSHIGVIDWLKKETTLEIREKPLIPHSFELLKNSGFISKGYLDSAQSRAIRIADLSAFLSCGGFEERLAFDQWLKSASQNDQSLMASKFIRLDWKLFWEAGSLINDLFYESRKSSPPGKELSPSKSTVPSISSNQVHASSGVLG